MLFPGVASPQWVLHQWQAGQEKELPFTPGLRCGGGYLRVVFHPPCVTGIWSMPSCQPPGLHGHWLPLAECALHTALTCQLCPPRGLLACTHRSCLWDELLPPTRIPGPWADQWAQSGEAMTLCCGRATQAKDPLTQKHQAGDLRPTDVPEANEFPKAGLLF